MFVTNRAVLAQAFRLLPHGSCLFLCLAALRATADLVILTPVADTMLIEEAPSNNAGGMSFFNAGTTQTYTRNRGLIRFDVAGAVPAGGTVTSAALVLEVVWRPRDGFNPATFGLHRLLRPWGEGSGTPSDPNHPGFGAPALPGESTWSAAFAFSSNLWSTPGGGAGTDLVAAASAEATVYGLEDSPYTFVSTPEMVADVQDWLDRREDNYGWMLLCQDERVNFTARRFATREDPARAPQMHIEFTPPARIESAEAKDGVFILRFTAQPGQAYSIEYTDGITGTGEWLNVTNVPPAAEATLVLVTDPLSAGPRFYRLRLR